MFDAAQLIDRYIAAWNETDAARRTALVAETFAEGATYSDPMMEGAGHDGIAALIAGVHERFPGFRFRLAREPEAMRRTVRFSWQLGPADAPDLVEGSDFASISDDGRIDSVTGFLDKVPAGLAS